ncbi:uncharacterized protein [Diadema setosum]|uniref:uncharacterized protein n=1 Tax=Diadema setosum TaxID=31175 RepID=UPI003B3BA6B4
MSLGCHILENIRAGDSLFQAKSRIASVRDGGIHVLNNGTDRVYVYDKSCRRQVVTLKLPDACLCCDIAFVQGQCCLLCGLRDGRILSCSLQLWCQQQKKKKRKRGQDEENNGAEAEVTTGKDKRKIHNGGGGGGIDDDIFGDLLAEDEATLQEAGGWDGDEMFSNEMEEFYQALGDVIQEVGDDCVVLAREGLESFTLINDHIIACCRESQGWRVSLHECRPDLGHKGLFRCEGTPAYSTLLLDAWDGAEDHTHVSHIRHPSSQSNNQSQETRDETTDEPPSSPLLYMVMSASTRDHTSHLLMQSSSVLTMSDALFDALFGSEVNLLESPVVLISLPDGRVFSLLLAACHTHRVRLLHHSTQPVEHIFAVTCTGTPTQSNSDYLAMVCGDGQIITFHVSSADSEIATETTHYTGGGVRAASATKNVLLCATSCDLAILTFNLSPRGNTLDMTSHYHSVSGLEAVCALKESSNSYKLLALKKNGTVLHLSVPSGEANSPKDSSISPVDAGQRIKELLHSIKEITSKMAALTKSDHEQSAVLEELSKAHHIVSLVGDRKSSRAFDCRARVICIPENGQRTVRVECSVKNNMEWVLSRGWTLVATLASHGMQAEGCVGHGRCDTSRYIPLIDFAPGSSLAITYGVGERRTAVSFPISVRFSLLFDGAALPGSIQCRTLNEKSGSFFHLDDQHLGTVFAIGTSIIDHLDALQPVQQSFHDRTNPGYKPQLGGSSHNANSGYVRGTSRKFAPFSVSNENQVPVSPGLSDSVDMSLCASLLKALTKGDKSPLEQLLPLLLPSNTQIQVKGHCFEAETPGGCLVSFQVVNSTSPEVVLLKITSSDSAVTKQLAEAVHRRLKNCELIQSPLTLDIETLNRELKSIEAHQAQLQAIQDQVTLGIQESETLRIAEELTGIYRNIREQLVVH